MTSRRAIFVDGENINSQYADEILEISEQHEPSDVRRVYGNATLIDGWAARPEFRLIHAETVKNSADILLSIDAMEFVFVKGVNSVVIVSSDGGFAHLATRMREHGIKVTGIGAEHASILLRNACTEFHQLSTPNKPKSKQPPTEHSAKQMKDAGPGAEANKPSPLDVMIRHVIAQHSKNGEGMQLAKLNAAMRKHHDIKISNYPEKTWRRYLNERSHLYGVDSKSPGAKVRFKHAGFAE